MPDEVADGIDGGLVEIVRARRGRVPTPAHVHVRDVLRVLLKAQSQPEGLCVHRHFVNLLAGVYPGPSASLHWGSGNSWECCTEEGSLGLRIYRLGVGNPL